MTDNVLEIATAPGDLPMPEILRRTTLLARQFRHDNTIAPLAPAPGEPIAIWATSGSNVPLARVVLRYADDGQCPEERAATVDMQPLETVWQPEAGLVTRWQGIIPGQPAGTIVRYAIAGWLAGSDESLGPDILAQDGSGFWFNSSQADGVTTFAFVVEEPHEVHPRWMQDAVVYQVFLDRFHPGTLDGRFAPGLDPQAKHGGTLRGVEQALPYLAELGVNCLWLSPIGPSKHYHHYDARDYFAIDPSLGNIADLRSLTDAAHALGMRVLLDFVPCHCSNEHPAFMAAQQDPGAPTRDWFTFYEWPHSYRSFLNLVPWLVSINADSEGARQYIIDSAIFWLREGGVDGFRLDHAIGAGMDFWTHFRVAVTAAKPDAVTIGEVTDTPDCLRHYRGRLHDVLDFPLARALRLTFGTREWSVSELHTFLESYDLFMAGGPGRASFLDNHDMDRFLYLAGGNTHRLKLAALCQFSLEQPPIIYYGTEIGLGQARGMNEDGFGGDVEVRQDMVWDAGAWDADLLEFYRTLIAARLNCPAVRAGARHLHYLDRQRQIYVYRRVADAADPGILVVLSLSEQPETVPLPPVKHHILVATSASLTVEPGQATLPPLSGAWLVPA